MQYDLPPKIDSDDHGRGILLGVIKDKPEYYIPADHTISMPETVTKPKYAPLTLADFSHQQLNDGETIGDHILSTETAYCAYDSLLPFGALMKASAKNRDTNGGLTDRQALIYGMRGIVGEPRQDVASWLDITPSTLDEIFRTAKKKIKYAREISDALSCD